MKLNNDFRVAVDQPLPPALKPVVPVNYFLFVCRTQDAIAVPLAATCVFYHTNAYPLMRFYKPISNLI